MKYLSLGNAIVSRCNTAFKAHFQLTEPRSIVAHAKLEPDCLDRYLPKKVSIIIVKQGYSSPRAVLPKAGAREGSAVILGQLRLVTSLYHQSFELHSQLQHLNI